MSTISLRLPESLHASARALAKRENISMNQLIALALAKKVSALMTEEYLYERGKRASRRNFDHPLNKVPHTAAGPHDSL